MDGRDWTFASEPAHPGDILKHDILPELGIDAEELADRLGRPREEISRILAREQGVSTVTAIRLGKAFRNGARFWLALQIQRDIWEKEREDEVEVEPFDWPHDGAA